MSRSSIIGGRKSAISFYFVLSRSISFVLSFTSFSSLLLPPSRHLRLESNCVHVSTILHASRLISRRSSASRSLKLYKHPLNLHMQIKEPAPTSPLLIKFGDANMPHNRHARQPIMILRALTLPGTTKLLGTSTLLFSLVPSTLLFGVDQCRWR